MDERAVGLTVFSGGMGGPAMGSMGKIRVL